MECSTLKPAEESSQEPQVMELGDGKLGVISVFGLIKDVKLKFLLDTGASHNFLSLHDAKSLGLPV